MSDTAMNLVDVTLPQLVLMGVGGLLWVIIYGHALFKGLKREFVPLPALAFCANLAWELLRGFVYGADTGGLLAISSKVFLVLKLFLAMVVLRYGYKQFPGVLKRHAVSLMVASVLVWGLFLNVFIPANDDALGFSSATLMHLQTSILFFFLQLSLFEQRGRKGVDALSMPMGWVKLVATLSIGAACYLHLPEQGWLHALWLVTFIFDVAYLIVFRVVKTARLLPPAFSTGTLHGMAIRRRFHAPWREPQGAFRVARIGHRSFRRFASRGALN